MSTRSPRSPPTATLIPTGLLHVLAAILDPRKRRGRRHSVAAVLAIALAATLTSTRSIAAIAQWAADAPVTVLAKLGSTAVAPSEATIRRILSRTAGDGLDAAIGAWMWLRTSTIDGSRVIAFDGKAVRGARDTGGKLPFLLAGLCQVTGTILAQIAVCQAPGLMENG